MSVLITGGAGYIGSHVVLALRDRGTDVVVVDNLVYGHREVLDPLEGVELVVGDIADRPLMKHVFETHSIEAVMHFSAYAYVGESVGNPSKYYRNNVVAMLNLLDETVAAGINKFVFSSTCATYGVPSEMPITENGLQNPINPYGMTKLTAERMLRDYDTAYGLKSVAFRYFNAAGADPAGRSGENHDPETHLIPLIFDAVCGRRPAIEIFGDDYETADGTCVRDYIHVADLASAHLLGLDYLTEHLCSQQLNLSTGAGCSVLEVIQAVERVTGQSVPVKFAPRRAGDPPVLVGDASNARTVLGWKPHYAELDVIIEHAWNWYKKMQGK
jgi:UDP-glucose 4-epimerase